jgi:hypothetical protein
MLAASGGKQVYFAVGNHQEYKLVCDELYRISYGKAVIKCRDRLTYGDTGVLAVKLAYSNWAGFRGLVIEDELLGMNYRAIEKYQINTQLLERLV